MDEQGPTYQPEHAGAPRRGRFRRDMPAPAASEPMMTPSEHRVVEALERSIDERLDRVLGEVERQATDLMREVAAEVWRAGAADVRPEQERIVSLLSRDQAIKSLMASSDERFQSLAVRSARLEDDLVELATQGRATREAIEASVEAVRADRRLPRDPRGRRDPHAARAGGGAHRGRLRASGRARSGDHRGRARTGARPRRPDRPGDRRASARRCRATSRAGPRRWACSPSASSSTPRRSPCTTRHLAEHRGGARERRDRARRRTAGHARRSGSGSAPGASRRSERRSNGWSTRGCARSPS